MPLMTVATSKTTCLSDDALFPIFMTRLGTSLFWLLALLVAGQLWAQEYPNLRSSSPFIDPEYLARKEQSRNQPVRALPKPPNLLQKEVQLKGITSIGDAHYFTVFDAKGPKLSQTFTLRLHQAGPRFKVIRYNQDDSSIVIKSEQNVATISLATPSWEAGSAAAARINTQSQEALQAQRQQQLQQVRSQTQNNASSSSPSSSTPRNLRRISRQDNSGNESGATPVTARQGGGAQRTPSPAQSGNSGNPSPISPGGGSTTNTSPNSNNEAPVPTPPRVVPRLPRRNF